MGVWDWIVSNGLFRDLESALIMVPIMRLVMGGYITRLEHAIERAAHVAYVDVEGAAEDAANAIDRERVKVEGDRVLRRAS